VAGFSTRQELQNCNINVSLGIRACGSTTSTHRQTWLFSSTSTYHSTDLLTARGVAHLVVHGTSGSTSYEAIPPVRLESSGGVLSTVDMVVQRRDGPRRLRDHDDDELQQQHQHHFTANSSVFRPLAQCN